MAVFLYFIKPHVLNTAFMGLESIQPLVSTLSFDDGVNGVKFMYPKMNNITRA